MLYLKWTNSIDLRDTVLDDWHLFGYRKPVFELPAMLNKKYYVQLAS